MGLKELFQRFDEEGKLLLTDASVNFNEVSWSPHASFEGVELKHIVTSAHTNGEFSYHLVRIAPNKKIGDHTHQLQLETHEVIFGKGVCVNNGKEIIYEPGVISILPKGISHEVSAGEEGLYLFAKFIPALL